MSDAKDTSTSAPTGARTVAERLIDAAKGTGTAENIAWSKVFHAAISNAPAQPCVAWGMGIADAAIGCITVRNRE